MLTFFFQDVDINKEYGNYSTTTRQSLEAWSVTELDLSLVCILRSELVIFMCIYLIALVDGTWKSLDIGIVSGGDPVPYMYE